MRYLLSLIFILFIGCNDNNSSSENIVDSLLDEVNVTEENSFPPPIPEKYLEKSVNNISIFSNEIIFGVGELQKVINFSNGNFSNITYSDNVDDNIFNISFELENFFKEFETSFIFRIDEVNSTRVLVLVFPNIKILSDGSLDNENLNKIYIYGLRSSGIPVAVEVNISDKDYIFSKNGRVFVDFGTSIDKISIEVGEDFSMNSYLKSDTKFKFTFAMTNIDKFEDSKDLFEDIQTEFKGDFKNFLENKLIKDKTFGFDGCIEIR